MRAIDSVVSIGAVVLRLALAVAAMLKYG